MLALLAFPCVNYVTTETTVDELGAAGLWWVLLASLNALALTIALGTCIALAYVASDVESTESTK